MRDATDMPDAMPSVSRVPEVEAGQMRQRHYRLRRPVAMLRRRQLNGLRLKARNPEQGLPIRRGFGVAWEIATPIVARMRPARSRPAPSCVIRSESRDDSPHGDEDIPRRNRQGEWLSRARKPPAHANQREAWRTLSTHGRTRQRPDREFPKL